ncbi:trifunctional purine biosynthetic protein adenosine-3 Gart [Rhynchophorus ferrugineus]|uniref:trifunctional purine biosynthetic protein adenosine-3 Gart n=1 Tax=Rhynchophorus ferrugineus TaxID=354439 RepID=UPI003FCD5B41
MGKSVLIIGGGGREHAIAWKLSQSEIVKNIFVAPGSSAIGEVNKATNIILNIKNFQEITKFCKDNNISLVIVGPEDPLADGISDTLLSNGINVFGPRKNAAQIESNKDWAKEFMDRHGIPTAKWKSFKDATKAKDFINSASFPALVVKASGLAAGKGVIVASNKQQACMAVDDILKDKKFGSAGETVVIEELLTGEEVSVLAFCDGKTVKPMLPAQDHKRIFENDVGPNTGGMGAYCPCPLLSKAQLDFVQKEVLERTVTGFLKENIDYTGVLYAGLMLTPDGPKVLEFNCRFGDPETEVILPLLETDLYSIMTSCCDKNLKCQDLVWKSNLHAVGVVMASKGYPESSSKGQIIKGIDTVNSKPNSIVFHCGTALKDGNLVTNGGRVLISVSLAQTLVEAAINATKSCDIIKFDGEQHRKDIAHKGIARSILLMGKMTYKESGVDIVTGNNLVDHIKPLAKSTNRSGVMGSIGGFGGLFDTKAAAYKDPLLVSGTDGVGTKLKIAQEINLHSTIGIDLVAMCVNDILAHGAEPLFFLDYFACGVLDTNIAKQVIDGIANGCRQAGCSLIGGETAEMPDMYPPGEYDLAGFAVGAVERDHLMPNIKSIQEGDIVIGLPSSGVHSNGFSLVRKVMKLASVTYNDEAPFSTEKKTFGEELLTATKIYVKSVLSAIKTENVKAFAHITGGGLVENIPRVLPKHLAVELDASKWLIPSVFSWLSTVGGINQSEMLRTFNCGIGGVLITKPIHSVDALNLVNNVEASIIGKVIRRTQDPVIVSNFAEVLEQSMKSHIPQLISSLNETKKRVAVLISGTGSNLQSLINATQDPTRHVGAEIVLVISNIPNVEGLKRAERAGISTKVIRHKDYNNRIDFDMAMDKELAKAGVEIICLAGFMRILSAEFVEKWRGRLINVHPALLPLFKGVHAQRQALEAGVRVSGCTVHFVEPDVDAGAILVQETVPIEIYDTEDTLTERIKTAEHKAYPKALKLLATGKVRLGSDKKIFWC